MIEFRQRRFQEQNLMPEAIKYLKPYFEHSKLVELITTLNNLEYSVQDDYSKSIVERIKSRIDDINDEMNSNN